MVRAKETTTTATSAVAVLKSTIPSSLTKPAAPVMNTPTWRPSPCMAPQSE